MGLDEQLGEFEARIDRMLGTTEPDPVEEASHLASLECALMEALRRRPSADPGHPVLADAAAWRDLAGESGAPGGAAEADAFMARQIEGETEAWKGHLSRCDDPDRCFRALTEARALDLEAISRRDMDPPLADALPDLRDGYLAAIERQPPSEEQRQAWATELIDRADVVLTGCDNLAPDRARVQLERVAQDLDWHVRHVETQHGPRRARLRWKLRRLRAETQERDLEFRLVAKYGRANVDGSEKLVLWLIVLVLGLLTIELVFDFSEETKRWLALVDALCCGVFITDIYTKLRLVQGRWWWSLRHMIVDILPSIPFAFMLRWARALRFVRVLRVTRFMRAFGFITRGIDRLVRKYGAVLNRDIVLYPTREERAAMRAQRQDASRRLRTLQSKVNERWQILLTTAPLESREAVVRARVDGLERARAAGLLHRPIRETAAPDELDLAADEVLRDLASVTPQQIEAEMGQDFVARVARAVRLFAVPPLRWIPVLRKYLPRIGHGMSDAEVVAAAAHQSARELKRHHDRYFWFADLHGTVTPAQFVDRVGTAMVKGAKRPAVRLLIFGALFLLLQFFIGRSHTGFMQGVHRWLDQVVGTFLQVLGGICFAILGVGWWLRRVAGQATEFFTQSARAQYIGLTEAIKGRRLERDADIFERRVFLPERLTSGADDEDRTRFVVQVRRWLVETQSDSAPRPGFDHVERAVWIYRDSLDGALLGSNDTHTTGQILGNPTLRNLRLTAARVSPRERKELTKLDLERQKSMLHGPYLWFSLICKAVEHGVARLLVDYNRHALPLGQLTRATDDERRTYEAWLEAETVADVPSEQVLYVTNEFTALHFLDADPDRDRHVEVRFGAAVLARLRRDRRHLTRRVFGTYPLHQRAREERVFNLYRVYNSWLAGGRALLIVFRAFWSWLRFVGRFFSWLARCVREVRRPRFTVDVEAAEGADFRTALRKIRRMRGPVAEAALRLRARFDPEYLGIRLPGTERSGLEQCDVHDDLAFLEADPDLAREMEAERQRASRDMVRLGRLIEGGLWERLGLEPRSREQLRAAAAAYMADMNRVRRYLSAPEILANGYERARRERLMPFSFWPRPRLKRAFHRYWKSNGRGPRHARRAAWRATVHNVNGLRDALEAWTEKGEDARAEGERILAELLRHPERISEQLVTLRTVQTLSLIDMLNYRSHVYKLGDYAASGDDPGDTLTLR